MTYALSWPLQQAIFRCLVDDAEVATLLGDRLYDAAPAQQVEALDLYATLGDEVVQDWGTGTDAGAIHFVTVSLFAPRRGFAEIKRAAGAVCDALLRNSLAMERGRAANVRFVDGRTRREEKGALRRIDLRFRLTLEDTA